MHIYLFSWKEISVYRYRYKQSFNYGSFWNNIEISRDAFWYPSFAEVSFKDSVAVLYKLTYGLNILFFSSCPHVHLLSESWTTTLKNRSVSLALLFCDHGAASSHIIFNTSISKHSVCWINYPFRTLCQIKQNLALLGCCLGPLDIALMPIVLLSKAESKNVLPPRLQIVVCARISI